MLSDADTIEYLKGILGHLDAGRYTVDEIAQADAVPVYMVFTNEQLAQMVQARATTKTALEILATGNWQLPITPAATARGSRRV
jgi:HRDC domain-containing protein